MARIYNGQDFNGDADAVRLVEQMNQMMQNIPQFHIQHQPFIFDHHVRHQRVQRDRRDGEHRQRNRQNRDRIRRSHQPNDHAHQQRDEGDEGDQENRDILMDEFGENWNVHFTI